MAVTGFLVPPWSTWITISDAHFLSCFTDAKTATKWKKLTTWWPWALSPQTYWSLRIDNVDPCDPTLLPHHQPQFFDSHTLWLPSLTLPLKMLPWNPLGSSGLLSASCLFLLSPAINLSLLPTPTFQFVWPHCMSGTRTWVWQQFQHEGSILMT